MRKSDCTILLFLLFTSCFVHGEVTYADMQLAYYKSSDEAEQDSQFWYQGIAQGPVNEKIGWFAYACADSDFQCVYAGPTMVVSIFEFGLGVGPSWYDGKASTVVNPWLYFEYNDFITTLHGEYTANESDSDEWYYERVRPNPQLRRRLPRFPKRHVGGAVRPRF